MRSGHLNDLWSAYRYGDKIKIVYHKNGKMRDFRKRKSAYVEYLEDMRKAEAYLYDESEPTPWDSIEPTCAERIAQSVSRTRSKIFELALCNPFKWFVTLTLDSEKRDRNDLSAFRKAFSQFVRNENKKRSKGQKIEYLVIPEQHKNGAWHMHGLFMGLTDADLVRNGYGYLDWPAYRKRFGFFSCSAIKSHEACSKYITKYVTKDIKQSTRLEGGQHSYYASQGLKRREVLELRSSEKIPFFDGDLPQNWDFENDFVKICWATIEDDGSVNFGK